MEENIELLKQMMEDVKTDISKLRSLKHAAVRCQQFELAANLRGLEKDLFPDTEEQAKERERVTQLSTLFSMFELKVDDRILYTIDKAIAAFKKKKGKFSVNDVVSIKVKAKELYPE